MERTLSPHRLVIGALQAALTLFGTQMAASILLANGNGTTVDVRLAGGLLPYLGIQSTPTEFVPLMSWSIAVAVGVTVTAALWNLLRRRDDPSLVLGWGSGLAMSFVLLGMHWVRHLLNPPLVDLWILGQALASVAAASCLFIVYRPRLEAPAPNNAIGGTSPDTAPPLSKQPALENS